jgi:hypothetical protein
VTTMEREQPHKTPVISMWTEDFLTRGEEGRKAVGGWLRDKTIPWKVRTNADVFPCEARLPNEAHIQIGSANCASAAESWASTCMAEVPPAAPRGTCRAVCAASKLRRQQGLTMPAFNRDKMI